MDTLSTEQLTRASYATPAPYAADFDMRWAAWVARGRAHEQHVRHAAFAWAAVIATAAAIVSALLWV